MCVCCVLFSTIAISIGFEFSSYTIEEINAGPIRNAIFLVKQDNRTTERVFLINIGVVDVAPPGTSVATIGDDYEIANVLPGSPPGRSILLQFNPFEDSLPITFDLFDDDIPEGPEAFQLQSSFAQEGLVFSTPNEVTVFSRTFVIIADSLAGGKCWWSNIIALVYCTIYTCPI